VEIRGELAGLDAKEQRLKASYLDGVLTLDEFRFEKNQFPKTARRSSGSVNVSPVATITHRPSSGRRRRPLTCSPYDVR
jgi:hypothetical protein